MNYGERLALAIHDAKVTRRTLAAHLDISVQALGQVLNGKTKALDALHHTQAAIFLGCDALWLAAGGRRHHTAQEPRAIYAGQPAGLTTSERDLVLSFRELPARRQAEVRDAVMAEARQYLADMRELAARHGTHSHVSAARAAATLPTRPDGEQPDTVPGTID